MRRTSIFSSWSLRKKLLLFILILFLPAFAIILASGLGERRQEIAQAKNSAFLVTQSLAAQQEQVLAATRTLLTMLAQTREVQSLDAKACNQVFAELQRRYPFYTVILAATPDGEVFAASKPFAPGTNIADRKNVRDAIEKRDFAVGEYIVGKVSHVVSINYGQPVLDRNQRLLAVVTAGVSLDEYQRFVTKIGLPDGYSTVITDWKGVRLFRSPLNPQTSIGVPVSKDLLNLVSGNREQGFQEWTAPDGIRRIYRFQKMRLTPHSPPYMCIAVGLPKDAILRAANMRMLRNLTILGVAAIGMILSAAALGNLLLLKPISRLVTATHQFGAGKMDTRTGLPHGSDEVGRLAQSFDEMLDEIERSVTAQKSVEQELRWKTAFLEAQVNSAIDGLLVIDSQGRKLLQNQQLVEMWDVPQQLLEEKDGRLLLQHVPPMTKDPERFSKRVMCLYAHPDETSRDEIELRDGRILDWYSSPVVGPDREYYGRIWAFRDITARCRAEEALLHSEKLASVGRMAASIAHEINNPLEALVNTIYLALMKAEEPDSVRHYLHIAEDELGRISHITRQTLGFYRESSSPKPVPVGSVMDSATDLLRAKIKLKKVTLEKQYKGDNKVMGIPGELRQVFSNLIVNSLDALEKDGTIRVRISQSACVHNGQRRVRVTVADNGKGIDSASLPRIFESLFTTKKGTGSGLGLWVSKQLIDKHHGSICVRTRTNGKWRGTTFSVTLPESEQTAKTRGAEAM